VLDTESSEFSHLWIPAFAGMTVFGLLTSSSNFVFPIKPSGMTIILKKVLNSYKISRQAALKESGA
jgi:hypothetical protein